MLKALVIASLLLPSISYARNARIADLTLLKPRISRPLAAQIARTINTYCDEDKRVLAIAIIFQESSFRPKASGVKGDYGLGQINARIWGFKGPELYDVELNLKVFCLILNATRDWTHYHSRTHSASKRYRIAVTRHLKRLNENAI